MKLDLSKILLIAALIFIGWQSFFKGDPKPDPIPVTIITPPSTGTSGIVDIEPEVIIDTVYIKGDTKIIEVDKGYKELYEKAQDSLEKKELFLEAIEIRKYADTIVDNEEILIKGKATTSGRLLSYSVDYSIKEGEFTYTPKAITELPNLSLGLGVEAGIPLAIDGNFAAKVNLSFMNKKGKIINVGYDTDKTVWVGFTRMFKIIK